jgi:hypothetical protein
VEASPRPSVAQTARITSKPEPSHPRREYLLALLADASGPTYDQLCRAAIERFDEPARPSWYCKARSIRAVRRLLWDELAVTESDESVWLTPAGWALVAELGLEPARRAS